MARVDVLHSPTPPSKKHAAPRGRTAVVAGVLLFVAIQLGVHSAVSRDDLPLRDPIYTEKFDTLKGHPEFFADSCDRHRVLAIGSSRTQLCLDAERLTDDRRTVLNFAAAGCGLLVVTPMLRIVWITIMLTLTKRARFAAAAACVLAILIAAIFAGGVEL